MNIQAIGSLIGVSIIFGTLIAAFIGNNVNAGALWGLLIGVLLSATFFLIKKYEEKTAKDGFRWWWQSSKKLAGKDSGDASKSGGDSSSEASKSSEKKTVSISETKVEKRSYIRRLGDGGQLVLWLLLAILIATLILYWGGPWFRVWVDESEVSIFPEKRQERPLTLQGSAFAEFRECGFQNGIWHYELTGDTTVSTQLGHGQTDLIEMKLWGTMQNADPVWYQRYRGSEGPRYHFALLANGKAPSETVRISDGCVTFAINVPYFVLKQQIRDGVRFTTPYHATAVFTTWRLWPF